MEIMVEVLTDVIGRNRKGEPCHPYKYQNGPKAGHYVYTLGGSDKFQTADEESLRALIVAGVFRSAGRIRMIPRGSQSTTGASALSVVSYKGIPLS